MIPLTKSAFLQEYETKEALADFILKSSRLSMDAKCFEFERVFAKFSCTKHAILFNSGGSANLAMIQAFKNLGQLKDGDAVGFSAVTWPTNVMPIIQLGLKAIPIDCEADTLNASAETLLEALKTTPLKAFFITNALGLAGDLGRIRDICAEREIIFFEDNCEALGTELASGKTGSFGVGASCSFFVAHHMSTIEGGMVVTDDDEYAEMLRIVRANGWDRNLSASQQAKWRHRYHVHSEFEAKYFFYDLGFNMRPTEITGFLGLSQLRLLDKNIQIRERNFLDLHATLAANSELCPLRFSHLKRVSSFAFPIVCKSPALREKYVREFSGAGIENRPMIAGNIQRQPFFQKYCPGGQNLPGAEILHNCGFYCGNYPELSHSDLETIKSCLFLKG